MRPRRLHVAGFTCFADPIDIDFTKLDVFAITGPTGAGKSTIIDAMCYALYGRIPRASDVRELLSHNRSALRVDLEFEAAGGVYRVGRAYNVVRKTKRDNTEAVTRSISPVVLEQRVEGEWVPLEGRVREIDDEVERIVGLDFDAFQKCVVLPQGRFQEFLAGDKKTRRAILKDLLDIGVYETVKKAANARHAELARDAEQTERRLREDYAEATEEALEATVAELAEATPARDAAVVLRDALTSALSSVHAVLAARKRRAEREEARKATLKEIEETKQLAADGVKRVAALKKDIAASEKQHQASPYDADRHNALSVGRSRALAMERLAGELAQSRRAADDASGVDAARAEAARVAERLAAAEASLTEATSAREAAERADAAAHVREGLRPGDPCPVCGGVVGKLPKAAASALANAKRTESSAAAAQKKAADDARAAQSALERAQGALATAKEHLARVERDAAEAGRELAAVLPEGVAPDAGAIGKALAVQEEARTARAAIESKIDGLRSQLAGLEPQVNASGAALAGLAAKADELAREAAAAGAEGDAGMAKLRALAEAQAWGEELALIERKETPQQSFERKHAAATQDAESLAVRVTQLTDRAGRIRQAIARAAELRAEARAHRERAALYHELGLLLRDDAFQQFVISTAMVALAETATVHLRDLYDRFEMTVDEGEFKVIDHWQADTVRPAKTLSGGETFVASLALALALSERLPELRSASASRLESLFLDEGFGTLDPETLQTVINVIDRLRQDSRMVGIITHVPDLAQRIDQQIVVQKSPAGSTIEVRGVLAAAEAPAGMPA